MLNPHALQVETRVAEMKNIKKEIDQIQDVNKNELSAAVVSVLSGVKFSQDSYAVQMETKVKEMEYIKKETDKILREIIEKMQKIRSDVDDQEDKWSSFQQLDPFHH